MEKKYIKQSTVCMMYPGHDGKYAAAELERKETK